MRSFTVVFLILVVLLGCSTKEDPQERGPLVTDVAWNERVQLNVPLSATVDKVEFRIKLPDGTTQTVTEENSLRSGAIVAFDLPDPFFPFLPDTSVTPPSANFPKNVSEYSLRATEVRARIVNPGGTALAVQTYQPSGSVVSGQVNVLLPKVQCPAESELSFQSLTIINRYVTESVPEGLCFLTLDIGAKGMRQAIEMLAVSLPNALAIDRNVVFNLDRAHRSSPSVDPRCSQIVAWIDPTAADLKVGYQIIDAKRMATSVNANAAVGKGAGVKVVVIGTGVGPGVAVSNHFDFTGSANPTMDEYSCDLKADGVAFDGHETHVGAIIKTLAPGVDLESVKVCDHHGSCPSAYVTMALMYVLDNLIGAAAPVIANLSAGGELPDETTFFLLQRPELVNSRFLLVSSAGNTRVRAPHYPGAYSPGSAAPGSLPNVMAVGAVGETLDEAGDSVWQVAEFTTAQGFDIHAPGVNICPATVTFRCISGASTYPDNLGASGTSFSAPFVTGVAALYAEANPGGNLRQLLISNRTSDGRVWYQ